jgi:hypothetical protein
MSELSTSGKTQRGQGDHDGATMAQILETFKDSSRPHSDESGAKLGHIAGVGDMAQQSKEVGDGYSVDWKSATDRSGPLKVWGRLVPPLSAGQGFF